MGKKRRNSYRKPPPRRSAFTARSLIVGAAILAAVGVVAVAVLLNSGSQEVGGATPWSTLRTADVHALAFDPLDPQHLYFGHHGGLLETRDGGRTWQATGLRGADAMNVAPPSEGFLQIAGHEVYKETTDGGRTWQDVPNNLPGLDLHAFVTDPADPSRAWTFAVGFGLFETVDRGRTWELRQPGNWGALTAFSEAGRTVLAGVGSSGLGRSDDGGRTWTPLAQPGGQVISLASSSDGTTLYAGTAEGLSRSTDGGRSWSATALETVSITVAVYPADPNVVAVVDDETRFFRSSDGGQTWPGP